MIDEAVRAEREAWSQPGGRPLFARDPPRACAHGSLHGLSGSGPKAGGPLTLPRFVLTDVVSANTAAAGGNAALLASDED